LELDIGRKDARRRTIFLLKFLAFRYLHSCCFTG